MRRYGAVGDSGGDGRAHRVHKGTACCTAARNPPLPGSCVCPSTIVRRVGHSERAKVGQIAHGVNRSAHGEQDGSAYGRPEAAVRWGRIGRFRWVISE